jgi:hypothetical protein
MYNAWSPWEEYFYKFYIPAESLIDKYFMVMSIFT